MPDVEWMHLKDFRAKHTRVEVKTIIVIDSQYCLEDGMKGWNDKCADKLPRGIEC